MKELLSKEQIQAFLDALEKKTGKKTLLVDMDGVVADFDKGALNWARNMGISGQEFKDKKMYRQPSFYLELEPMEGALEAIQKLEPKFEIRFVSAPSWGNPNSFTEKRLWIEKHFSTWAEKRMDLTFRKDLFMGHYLVDDRLKYGAGEVLGEHIMFGNETFPTWKEVTDYLLSDER
jgi:5'(3')-deoxyribonucleotidase